MADLYKLQVKLEAESAKLHADLDRANKKLGRFQKSAGSAGNAIKKMGKVGAVAFTAISAAIAGMAVKSINLADKIGKLSQSTGVSTETLSRLRFAADLSGVSLDAVAKSTGRLQRAMFDASMGLKAPQDAFDELGVTATDSSGKLKDTEAVMLEIADKFSMMEDGAKKAALAQVVFGKAGVAMIPFLNQGAKGIKAMTDEADALGLTMSGKLTAAAEQTNDNLTRMKAAMEGAFLRVMAQAMPHIVEFTKAMVVWAKDTSKVSDALSFLGKFLKVIATGGIFLAGVLNSVGKGIGGLAAATMAAVNGEFSQAAYILEESWKDSDKALSDSFESIEKMWADTPKKIADSAESTAEKMASPIDGAEKKIELSVANVKEKLKTLETEMKNAVKKSADISKQFQDRFDTLTSSKKSTDQADVIDVGALEFDAQQALNNGDIDGATKKLSNAFDILDAMKAAGSESGLVLEGLGASLKRVGDQIGDKGVTDVVAKIDVDLNAAVISAMNGNEAMQKAISAHPLIQTILFDEQSVVNDTLQINPASIPNGATQAANQQQNYRPVVVNLPGGGSHTLYSDDSTADRFASEIQRESNKRGRR